MLKKALSTIRSKKFRSITSVLLAICLTAVILIGITPAQATLSSVGKMLEVYNQNGYTGQEIQQQYKSLPAGTYELSAHYKQEGGWTIQAQIYSGDKWTQVSGATVTESEDEYFTTIAFTLTSAANFRIVFTAPTSTNKMWLANVILRSEDNTTNLLKNGDFSNGITDWSFSNQTSVFPNAATKDIEEGFFDKSIEPLSGKMMEVYNQAGKENQPIYRKVYGANMPAGTYKLSAYFKHEGGWKMQILVQQTNGGTWTEVSNVLYEESEDKYLTTATFTVSAYNELRVRFIAPTNESKMWLANVSLKHVSGGTHIGNCTPYLSNGDFTTNRDNRPAGLAFWDFSNTFSASTFTQPVATEVFSNAKALPIEEGFFDKGTEPLSGNMMEVYNQSGWTDQILYRYAKSLPAGTYQISAYYKHEGGWSMKALQSSSENGTYTQISSAKVVESEDKYYTTITFTLTSTAFVRAQFNAPTSNSKLWLANLSLRRISGGELGSCKNFFGNSDFTVTRDGLPAGLAFWTFTNLDKAFPNAQALSIGEGFFDKITETEAPTGKMLTANKAAGHAKLGIAQYIDSLPAGTYELSSYFKQTGGWTFNIETWQDDANDWMPIANSVSETPEGWHFKTINFTLSAATKVRIKFTASSTGGSLWVANVKLHRSGDIGNCKGYVTNGYFLDNTTGWVEEDYEDKITNIETVDIPQDWFFVTLSNQELFDHIIKILSKKATIDEYPDSDINRNGITDIVDLLLIEKRMLAGASVEANAKRTAIINSESGIDNTSTVIYVSENGDDSTGDGSQENPYKTVEQANATEKKK